MSSTFSARVAALPHLGIGVSTEFGAAAAPGSLDIAALQAAAPRFAEFLEIGVEQCRGLDQASANWIAAGQPNTYHFLDINLDEPADFDEAWLQAVSESCEYMQPAWLCGDAGMWHFGRRDRGHMLLLPPVLSTDNADAMAEGIVRLREATGREVLPENPPGTVYVGDMHLLDFFARVCERADSGMLLDVAHLIIYQQLMGNEPLDGLADFPLERVVEMHVAGASRSDYQGFQYLEDSHTPSVPEATWSALTRVAEGADNLRAVVFECERNMLEQCLPGFERIEAELAHTAFGRARAARHG